MAIQVKSNHFDWYLRGVQESTDELNWELQSHVGFGFSLKKEHLTLCSQILSFLGKLYLELSYQDFLNLEIQIYLS